MRRVLALVLAGLLGATAACGRPLASEPPPAPDDTELPSWSTKRFHLRTDAPAAVARMALEAAERTDRALDELLGTRPEHSPRRTIIWLVERDAARRSAARCGHDAEAAVDCGSGAFYSRACGLVHVLDLDPELRELVTRVIAHEVVHQRVAADGYAELRGAGAWISEGLATLLESYAEGERDAPRKAERFAQARGLAERGRLMALSRFAGLDRAAVRALGWVDVFYSWRGVVHQRPVARAYAEAQAAAAFLAASSGDRFPSFVCEALRHGASPPRLARAVGVPVADLDASFMRWLGQRKPARAETGAGHHSKQGDHHHEAR